MTRLYPLALALLLAAAPMMVTDAFAASPPPSGWRATSDVATHLAENGFRVLKLEQEADGFEAELIDREGNLVEARVHPVSAELLSTRSEGRAGSVNGQWLTLAQVARHLESKGFAVRKIETEAHGYEVDVTDHTGARTDAVVDPMTADILSAKPE